MGKAVLQMVCLPTPLRRIHEPIHSCLTVVFFFCFICLSLSLPHLSYGCCSWFNVRSHFFTNTNSRSDSTSRCIATEHTHTHTHILSFTYDMNLKQKNTAKSIFKLHTKNSQHCEAICKRLLLLSFDSKSKLSQ